MRGGLVAITAVLAFAAALPSVAAADNDECTLDVPAATDLAGPAPERSCTMVWTCRSADCHLGRVGGLAWATAGQVGMRMSETAGGRQSECVGVGSCSVAFSTAEPSYFIGEVVYITCALRNYAAVDVHVWCTNDYSF